MNQQLIDDQKFQDQKLENKRLTDRIEGEANEATICPSCPSSNWRMKPWYEVSEQPHSYYGMPQTVLSNVREILVPVKRREIAHPRGQPKVSEPQAR
jgi:hypothetical protein